MKNNLQNTEIITSLSLLEMRVLYPSAFSAQTSAFFTFTFLGCSLFPLLCTAIITLKSTVPLHSRTETLTVKGNSCWTKVSAAAMIFTTWTHTVCTVLVMSYKFPTSTSDWNVAEQLHLHFQVEVTIINS